MVNISSRDIKDVTLKIDENISEVFNAETSENMKFTFDINSYGYKILYLS